jgi:hypothetical protein
MLEQVAHRYGHLTATDDRTAADFADTARDLRRRVRGAIERPEPPAYAGPCPGRGTGDGCPGEIYMPRDREEARCRECGTLVTVDAQRAYLARELDARLMTCSEIVSALVTLGIEVPHATVRTWVHRRRLVEHADGAGLYRLADAVTLARARHARTVV